MPPAAQSGHDRATGERRWRRPVRAVTWAEAVILTGYGFVLTVVGLLVQAGAIQPVAHADHRALEWHAYLWDPWFLIWGILVLIALRQSNAQIGN